MSDKKTVTIKRIDLIRGRRILHYKWNASGDKIPVYSEHWEITDVDGNRYDEFQNYRFVCPEIALIQELVR